MKFEEIRLENIGPVRQATIGCHKLSVFMGPNNSGKSIASRIVHGVRQLGPTDGAQPCTGTPGGDHGEQLVFERAHAVLKNAGIAWSDIVTHTLPSGRLEIANGDGAPVRLDFERGVTAGGATPSAPPPGGALPKEVKDSIYVPAGRTGTLQSLLAVMQIKNDLFNSVLDVADEHRPLGSGRGRALDGTPQLNLKKRMPAYLEQFSSTVMETISGGLAEQARMTFSKLFGGSLDASAATGIPSILYRDPSGFGVEIESAGLGVVSSFPIIAAVHDIEPGGTLIVEEPEAHMEPLRQQSLVNEIVRVALARRVSLVLVTHSDYVVNGVLNMVYAGIIGPDDLGLYYFRRRDGSFTQVERIPVDKTGEAEQELFEEALDALAKGGTIKGDP